MKDILFILVIYQKALSDSRAYQSLSRLIDRESLHECLYVHDNSNHNQYLATAYNEGATIARKQGKKWIVLLDDDMYITQDYITQLLMHITHPSYQVIAPKLTNQQGKLLSPTNRYGIKVVFNSAMAIRLSTLEQIGGFCQRYPLDYLDYYTCWQLHLHGIDITMLDVSLGHQLSVEDYAHVTADRYTSILQAEKQFAHDTGHMGRYRLQLLGRTIKWVFTGHKYIGQTLRAICKQ